MGGLGPHLGKFWGPTFWGTDLGIRFVEEKGTTLEGGWNTLIDDWPEDVVCNLINESMTNFKQPNQFYYNDIKYFEDGTFEMIPEKPEWMKVDFNDFMKQQTKLNNGGKNILEIIKTLPCVANQKLQMYKLLERRDAKKIPSYCEFIGLSASHVRPWLGSQVPWSWKKGRPRASAQAARAMMSDVPPVFGRWMKDTTPWSTSGGRRQARS